MAGLLDYLFELDASRYANGHGSQGINATGSRPRCQDHAQSAKLTRDDQVYPVQSIP